MILYLEDLLIKIKFLGYFKICYQKLFYKADILNKIMIIDSN